ncbi:MAG: hypothetical protein IPK07_13880 [Deltaproteobacteria bacterium]|nr:hypothetical protein [Deltaproteobacteria bacterium]
MNESVWTTLKTVLLVAGAILGSFVWRAVLCRIRGGRFEVDSDANRIRFETDLGSFTFHRRNRQVRIRTRKGETRVLDGADIDGVRIGLESRSSLLELADGWDLGDTFGRYRDKDHTWSVRLRLRGGETIPVMVLSQYEVRDFLDFVTPMQLAALGALGLYRDGESVAANAARQLEHALRWIAEPATDSASRAS